MVIRGRKIIFYSKNFPFYFKYASDIEQSDRSNVTTDDEFYNELMDAPPEFEDRLSMKKNIYRI